MRIIAIVREVSKEDKSLYAVGPEGPMFMGHPLRDFLSRMDADGYISVPLPPGPLGAVKPVTTADPELSLTNPQVDPDVHIEIVDERTLRVSIAKWRDRDPDNTFLRVAFQFTPTTEAERAAIINSPDPIGPRF
jgi:hypothetical protein